MQTITYTDTQTDGHTEMQTKDYEDIQKCRQMNMKTYRNVEMNMKTYRNTYTLTDNYADRHAD